MADINQEIEQIVAEMREVGKQAAPCKGGNYNNLLRYNELRERILSKFLEVFDTGGRLEMPTLTPPNEWVSVYDRLPESGERVLATDCGFVGEFYINKRGKWQRYNVNCSELLMALDILYWMPLPAPPDCRPPEGEGKPTEPPNV